MEKREIKTLTQEQLDRATDAQGFTRMTLLHPLSESERDALRRADRAAERWAKFKDNAKQIAELIFSVAVVGGLAWFIYTLIEYDSGNAAIFSFLAALAVYIFVKTRR